MKATDLEKTTQTLTSKVSDIVFREDLYPRFDFDQAKIDSYKNSIDFLPPIVISQDNILIDGYHRLAAHKLAKREEITCNVIEVASDKEIKILAYKLNSTHGLQLSNKEKRKFAQEMFRELPIKEIAEILSVSQSIVYKWTEKQIKDSREDRNRKIRECYLRALNSEQSIAEILKTSQPTVSRVLQNYKSKIIEDSKNGILNNNFKPFCFNIWNNHKNNENQANHYGRFPQVFMENLIYYHTEPFDLIYDPFSGGGTTVDVCQKLHRRYYCSDRIVRPGREKDIREWDIKNELPEDLPKVDLVFLDPPYPNQARNKYSRDDDDLGNMNLEEYYDRIRNLLHLIYEKRIPKIAIVIAPHQFGEKPSDEWIFYDHIFEIDRMIYSKYKKIQRYSLPYPTSVYSANVVEEAKKRKQCLRLNRDLVVYELIENKEEK